MKKNQRGFGVVEALLIVVAVGLVGGAGWYVWQNRQSKPQSIITNQEASQTNKQVETKPAAKSTETCDTSYKSLSNEKIGIAFCYPDSWSTEIIDTASNPVVGTVTLTSPNYKEEETGYGGSNTGSRLLVFVNKIDQPGPSYTSVKSILDGTEQDKKLYSDIEAIKIAGKDGAKFISEYEGPRSLTNQFEYKGNQYSIILEEDLDGPKFNDNLDAYQKIVNSFEILAE